jgi:orotate phosphoribosyltransferase
MALAQSKTIPDNDRERLREIISEKSFNIGDEFVLSSGRRSNVFFNLKQTMLDPEGANIMADMILDIMKRHEITNVGGLEMGAVPLVASVCTKSYPDYPVSAFFIRKKAKQHGAKQSVDGHIRPNSNVIIVDDVTTTGSSVMKAVEVAKGHNCDVKAVVSIVDREEGALDFLLNRGIKLISLLRKSDFTATK